MTIFVPSDWINPGHNPLECEIKCKRIWLRLPRTTRIRRKVAQAWCRAHAGNYSKRIMSVVRFLKARYYKARAI